jgi:hypothetical protein
VDREYDIFEYLPDHAAVRLSRAKLLRDLGYAVTSAMGNEAAKFLLTTLRPRANDIARFIVGQNAPTETRAAMVDLLRTNLVHSGAPGGV